MFVECVFFKISCITIAISHRNVINIFLRKTWKSCGPNSYLDKKDIVSIRQTIKEAGGEAEDVASIKD